MIDISQLIGQKIVVVLKEAALESPVLGNAFQGENIFIATMAGVDFIGLWIVIPDVILIKTTDKDGKPLPEKKRSREKAIEHLLIKWEYVEAISAFPEKEEELVQYKKEIGFNRKNTKSPT